MIFQIHQVPPGKVLESTRELIVDQHISCEASQLTDSLSSIFYFQFLIIDYDNSWLVNNNYLQKQLNGFIKKPKILVRNSKSKVTKFKNQNINNDNKYISTTVFQIIILYEWKWFFGPFCDICSIQKSSVF